jgi:hypothetical protein
VPNLLDVASHANWGFRQFTMCGKGDTRHARAGFRHD